MDIENDQIINSAEADAAVDKKRCSLNVLNMI
jgi:hypothetical protein